MTNSNNELSKFDALLDAYRKRFGENFDTFALGNDITDISSAIEECLASGKPYQDDLPPNAIY